MWYDDTILPGKGEFFMLETLLLGGFSIALLACVLSGMPILFALAFGLALFSGYALAKGNTPRAVLSMWWSGVRTIVPILVTFVLIGCITALWRASGTIPAIVAYGSALVPPAAMVLGTFVLCALMSVLTGTAFGTGATMGVICMTMARGVGASELTELFVGGAIVAGSYFGDRMSPMSTSALLVATLTHTDIYKNLKAMLRTSLVPMILACVIYLVLGFVGTTGADHLHESAGEGVTALFTQSFDLSLVTLVPALLVIVFSFLRWHVQRMMATSIAAAAVVAVAWQGIAFIDLPHIVVFGFQPDDPALAAAIGGGGILSMGRVTAIVCLSSCYAGLFEETGFLRAFITRIEMLAARITPFGSVFAAGLGTGMIACNQTLSILLTYDLCKTAEPDKEKLAVAIENTAVVLSPVIPWSIAAAVPLAATGAPTACLAFAVYLYLLPLWNWGVAMKKAH